MKYRHRSQTAENTEIALFTNTEGAYGIPVIEGIPPVDDDFSVMAVTDMIVRETPPDYSTEGCLLHFFVDDYRFKRLWNNPTKYINILRGFKYVLSPDFSTYTNYPPALNIYNHYRKHWLGAYWQRMGIKVIPTISWTGNNFEWCFDGEPRESVVAVSSVGCARNRKNIRNFLIGYSKMIEVLKPTQIIFMGKDILPKGADRSKIIFKDNNETKPWRV